MKSLITGYISGLLVLIYSNAGYATTIRISSEQIHIMNEEYHFVQRMRHQLKYLLERQKIENRLQKGEDTFLDLEKLEQWLEQMKQGVEEDKMEKLLGILKTLENRLNQNFTAQEDLGHWLKSKMINELQTQIPLNPLIDSLSELIRNRQFEKAQELIDQLQWALKRQHLFLEQALANENIKRFSQYSQHLQQMISQIKQAFSQETIVMSLLQPKTYLKNIPGNSQQKAEKIQTLISGLISKLQSSIGQITDSTLLNTQISLRELNMSSNYSQNTEKWLKQSLLVSAFKSASNTRKSLERLKNNLQELEDKVQQISRKRLIARPKGREQRYWSEKGIRPIKLEYEFRANPLFRDRIQQQKSGNNQNQTHLQQQYLKEVMR